MNQERAFLLNDRAASLAPDERGLVLAWLRRRQGLVGTKEGCGEGECGACTVLLGEAAGDGLVYRAVTSCLLSLAELPGRHLVTIEGLNPPAGLGPIQQALVDAGAPQCGFCFPGIVVSLAGFFLCSRDLSPDDAVAALDGNICRCTGYHAIRRAIDTLSAAYAPRLDPGRPRVAQLVAWGVLPAHFAGAAGRLADLAGRSADAPAPAAAGGLLMGGGTDLLIQRPEVLDEATGPVCLSRRRELAAIRAVGEHLVIGGGVTVEALTHSEELCRLVPVVPEALARFGSTIIRNLATVAGNLVNASPIGDVTALLLALDAELVLESGAERTLPLADFYLGYKQLALAAGEVVTAVRIPLAVGGDTVSFEKISPRRFLDIASVNSAARFTLQGGGEVASVTLAVGGVAPVPYLARATMAFLHGRRLDAATVREAARVLDGEIAPIDDVRGTAAYKRELARRLLFAHALRAAPDRVRLEELV